ncbi:MAG: hypothetical protein ACSHW2_01275 [Parasphingopyxis sp.]|uniref:Uncharacterized protein n=1 Tax=Parasphingopyxis lamellibrachiae TaxID=680125 RepID=A0A3D9FE59_9SPHN|nr:hypothetical protein [Parasphingopyxis lamellibrachiae]RED16125.1 hypothetical protein DFR46_1139 [Parasphingopyxis lamellibrachiae]
MSLLIDIDRFLRRSGISPTRFGREAVNDPRFVFDIRKGRECGGKVSARVYAFMAKAEGKPGQCG